MSDFLKAAELSLEEAERLEGEGTRSEVRQELLLGILQSNIAIAEALTADKCDPDEWPEECGDCECDLKWRIADCDDEWKPLDLCDEDCPFCADEQEDEPNPLRIRKDGDTVTVENPPPGFALNRDLFADPGIRVLFRWGIAG